MRVIFLLSLLVLCTAEIQVDEIIEPEDTFAELMQLPTTLVQEAAAAKTKPVHKNAPKKKPLKKKASPKQAPKKKASPKKAPKKKASPKKPKKKAGPKKAPKKKASPKKALKKKASPKKALKKKASPKKPKKKASPKKAKKAKKTKKSKDETLTSVHKSGSKREGEGPKDLAEPPQHHLKCGKGKGKTTTYQMRTMSHERFGETVHGKRRMKIQTLKTKIKFVVTDIAQGCIHQKMHQRLKVMKYKGGIFPQKSRKFHMMAHWLRMLEVTGYVSGMSMSDHKGRTKYKRFSSRKVNRMMVKRLRCKMGFLQSKDGHVLSIFHEKNSRPGCKKIKTQMAEAFESYYFQNGLRQYHTMGKDNGKLARQLITVDEGKGELVRVCRRTAPSVANQRVGPGGHKGRRSLKVGKGYMICCNHYNRNGSMRHSTCYFKQRPGRGGMGRLTKNKPTPKFVKHLKRVTKKLPKSQRSAHVGSHFGKKEEELVQEHLSESFDASSNLEDAFTIATSAGKAQDGHYHGGHRKLMRGEIRGPPPKGSAPEGQPAIKVNGGQHINLVAEHEAPELKEFKTADTDELLSLLHGEWGVEAKEGAMGDDNHSNKGGWADISPVQNFEYADAAKRLEEQPDHKDTYNMLVDLYQRDGRAVNRIVEHMVKNQKHISRKAQQTAVNALQGAADHEASQHALAKLLTTPGFEVLAADSTHSIEAVDDSVAQALELNAFEGGEASKMAEKQCTNLLALGAAASSMNDKVQASRIAGRLLKGALNQKASDCFIHALGNAGAVASKKHVSQMLKALRTGMPDERRAALLAALTYMPDARIDEFLGQQFSKEKTKPMKLVVAKVLSERDNGTATEHGITLLALSVKKMQPSDKLTLALKGLFRARIKAFHSPAATKLLLVNAKDKVKALLNPNLSLTRCSLFEGKQGKISCERGLARCVDIAGKRLGCIGGSAYAYANYAKGWLHAEARAAAGFQLEFFKWSVKLFATDNDFKVDGLSGHVLAYAKYFNIKTMQYVTIYNLPKREMTNLNSKGNSCRANQLTDWSKEKSVSKTFFTATVCYGLPKIASICGEASLKGAMGIRAGFGLIYPSKDAILLNLRPQANVDIAISVSGNVAGFKGYVTGTVSLVDAKLPASAIVEYKHYRRGGYYLGWKIDLLKSTITAGVKWGVACEEEMAATANLLGAWGKGKKKAANALELTMEDSHVTGLRDNESQLMATEWGGRRRRRWFKAVTKVVKKVATAVVKVVEAVKCSNIYGPKTIMSYGGITYGGTILNKDTGAPKCHGQPGKDGFGGPGAAYKAPAPPAPPAAARRRRTRRRRYSARRRRSSRRRRRRRL